MPSQSSNKDDLCSACQVMLGRYTGWSFEWEMPLRDQLDWIDNYRMIFRPYDNSLFQLSGIGRRVGEYQKPPWDRSKKWGSERSMSVLYGPYIKLADISDLETGHEAPYGYPIHAACWDLIERIIGPQAEEKLDILVQVLHEKWQQKSFFEVDQFINKKLSARVTRWVWKKPPRYPLERKAPCYHYKVSTSHFDDPTRECKRIWSDYIVPLRDPFNIPNVRYLIQRCRRNGANQGTGLKKKEWNPRSSASYSNSPILTLPTDIKLLVLDWLEDADLLNSIEAFHWSIHDGYWKGRLPRRLVFELDKVGKEEMDWLTLCLELEQMAKTLPELQNRQRIFRILDSVKKSFFEKLNDPKDKNPNMGLNVIRE